MGFALPALGAAAESTRLRCGAAIGRGRSTAAALSATADSLPTAPATSLTTTATIQMTYAKELFDDLGGGVRDGKALKCWIPGGASAPWFVPSEHLDTPVTIERIAELVPNVRQVNRWAWLDSVAERDYRTALKDLPVLLSGPDSSAVGLINAMTDHHVLLGIAAEGGASLLERTLGEVGKPYLKFNVRTFGNQ